MRDSRDNSPSDTAPRHISGAIAEAVMASCCATPSKPVALDLKHVFTVVKLTPLSAGVPTTCARIYRLPTTPALRNAWLSLEHSGRSSVNSDTAKSRIRPEQGEPRRIRQRHLAASLLECAFETEPARYPAVPGVEDLIGFVTTGNFNLSQGKGTGIGNILLSKAIGLDRTGADKHDAKGVERGGRQGDIRLCIVRNAGQVRGRLARWQLI